MGCSSSKDVTHGASATATRSARPTKSQLEAPKYYTAESVQPQQRQPQPQPQPQPQHQHHQQPQQPKPQTHSREITFSSGTARPVTASKPRSEPRPPRADLVSIAPSLAQSVKTMKEDFRSQYEEGSQLGYGAFAIVFVGRHIASGKRYAIKKIDRGKMQWGDRDALEDEINNLKLVREGPNIVQLYEVYYERMDCYLVTELMMGGELFDRIIQKKTFTEQEARDCLYCILAALDYMHQRRVVHRDLKPENLLLKNRSSDTNLKLADFGFAKKVTHRNSCRTLCGTPGYLAPEILERWPAYDTPCDLWSVGVILFLLLGGYLPFDDDDEDVVFDNTRNGDYVFHPKYWNNVSLSAKDLVTKLLTVNSLKRINAATALKHEWMQKSKTLGMKQLDVDKLKATMAAKEKVKAAVNAVIAADRLQVLRRDFDSYLSKKQDSMSVFSKQSIQPHSRPEVEDSASGKPFRHFYDMGSLLGEGGFATVNRATHKSSGQVVAVKCVDNSRLQGTSLTSLQEEISALKILRGGPYIVRLLDVFEDPERTYIVMEEMQGGELLQRITEKEVYTEREARQLCEILFDAVDYCHKKSIAHRDLKPENLLLKEKGDDTSIKIADFGFAKKVHAPCSLKTLCGTASYVAPEVLDLQWGGYDQRADMWSVGVIVYILLGGYAPFEGPIEELAAVIIRGEYTFHDEFWSHISKSAKDLIKSLLQVRPNLRLSAEEALQTDWMVVEAESLLTHDLTRAQTIIRNAYPVEKVKGAVNAIILANKLTADGRTFTKKLGTTEDLKKRVSVAPSQMRTKKKADAVATIATRPEKIEDSSSGKKFVELYRVGTEIGKGSFSVVLEAYHKQSGEAFAVKCIPRQNLHPSDAVAVQDEITALKAVTGCPQVVRLHDRFEDFDATRLVLELMRGGDLIDRIIKKKSYTEMDAKTVCATLLQGIKYCHKRKIANRNLKPENLLLVSEESDTDVKISDFGYAKKVLFPNSLRTQCGTEGYVAPEILEHRPAYDVSCDMWSLGVVLYILLGGYRPFRGTTDEVMRKIRYGEYEFHDRYWSHVSPDAKELVRRMMTVDPEARVTATEALQSRWINADDDELTRTDLSDNLTKLKEFKAKQRFRGAVTTVIAMNKLKSLGGGYI